MSEANRELAKRWFEQVWNQRRESAIDEMFHPEGKAFGLPGVEGVVEGPAAFKPFYRSFLQAFPDVRIQIEDVIAEGDRVAVRWVATATHLGDNLGFPATGKAGSLEGSSFLRVKDGVILDGWNQMDFQAFVNRLQER